LGTVGKVIKFVVGAAVALGGVALVLAPKREGDVVPQGVVVVRYWEKWTGREGAQMKEIVDWFNATVGKEKGIFVQYVSMSGISEKTLVSTAAGMPPDVAGLWDAQPTQFAALDALEPLGARAKAKGIVRELYKPAYWDACLWEGELYALPSTPAVVALHWNKKLFRENADALRKAGLDPDRAPRTIQELDKYAAVLDVWKDGRLVRAGHLPQEPGWWLTSIYAWFGGRAYDPGTRKLTLTSPEVVASYEWVAGYTQRLGLGEMKMFRAGFPQGFDSPQTPFFAGTVAMVMQGTWMANFIDSHNPRLMNRRGLSKEELRKLSRDELRENADFGVAPFPSAVAGVTDACLVSMDTLVIPRTAKHKDEAFEFIAFVQRQDVMEKLVSMHCKNSPLRAMSEQYIRNHPNPYIEEFERLAMSPNAVGPTALPVWSEVNAEIGVAAERVYLGELTPREAMEQAQERGQKAIDKFFERRALRKGGVQ
jgi:ABC-type glycerol-3-phosphate transport system substrate-binding protein